MMRTDVRCVVDTNVLISAVLTGQGTSNRAVETILQQEILLSSEATLNELETSLRREKFRRYVTLERVAQYVDVIGGASEFVEIVESVEGSRDPDDDKFLQLAVNGSADVIVSGDADLLDLHPFRKIQILSPRAFLDWVYED